MEPNLRRNRYVQNCRYCGRRRFAYHRQVVYCVVRRYTISLPQTLKSDVTSPRTANSRTGSAQNTPTHRIPRPLLCRISSARLHCVEAIHSPRSARNAGHRFTKNSYQLFFPRSPYLFGARDTISTNYTCCAVCTFHLLACQYTAFAVCTRMYHIDAPKVVLFLFLGFGDPYVSNPLAHAKSSIS